MADESERYRAEVRRLIAEVLHLDLARVPEALSFGDVPEWDSLGHMDLLMTLENRYGVSLNEERIARLVSIDAICREIADNQHA